MADRSVKVELKAGVSDFIAGMERAKAATGDFAKSATTSAEQHSRQWSQVGTVVAGVGLAIAAGVGFAVSRFADFDQAMSGVGAATRATSGDLEQLRDAALKAGQDTQFSATEAANAITALAKAGVSTKDILGGGLKGALDLAAAGQMDVADAAELAATAMTQFKLSGQDLPHVADLLAAGAGKAQGEVSDMGMALKQAGLVAQQTGLSIEETTGALAAFASAGLIGSDAGTSFKSMLQRLTPQSAEAATLMQQLGISAYDAGGNFIGLEQFAGNLRAALQGLTVEERNSALATIFGSDAVRAAAVLYDQGAEGVRKWTNNVNDAGFAQEQARRLTDNWKGDLERLSGALDTAFIKSGTGANNALRGITQGIEGVVNKFNDLSPAAQSSVVYIGAVTAAVALVGGGALIAVPKILAFKTALETLGLTAGKTGIAMRTLAAAGALFATAGIANSIADMGAAAQVASPGTDRLANGLRELAGGAAESKDFGSVFAQGLGVFRNDAEKTSFALEQFGIIAKKALDPGMFDGFSGASGRFQEQARQIDQALTQLVKGGSADVAKQAFDKLGEAARAQGVDLQQLAAQFPNYTAAVAEAGAQSTTAAGGVDTAKQSLDLVAQSAKIAQEATDSFIKTLQGINDPALQARESARAWEEAIASATQALQTNGATLDVTTAKGRQNEAALDAMASAAIDNVAAMAANGASQAQLQGQLATSRSRLEAAAIGFGMSKEQARQYVDQVLRVPPVVSTSFSTPGLAQSYAQIVAYANAVSSIPRERATIIRTIQITQNKLDNPAVNPGFAEGGLVVGPGGPTSDNLLAAVSPGEYWVKAAAVKKYGVDFMDRINAMRFADGGLVARAQTAPAPLEAQSRIGPTFTVGQVVAADPKEAVRELNIRWRDALAAQGVA